jgi:hypothetical protein
LLHPPLGEGSLKSGHRFGHHGLCLGMKEDGGKGMVRLGGWHVSEAGCA